MPTLSLRLSRDEIREVRRRARLAGKKNLSAYVRAAILPGSDRPAGRPRLVRDKLTGSLVLHSPPGTPALTPETVRDMLADFP